VLIKNPFVDFFSIDIKEMTDHVDLLSLNIRVLYIVYTVIKESYSNGFQRSYINL